MADDTMQYENQKFSILQHDFVRIRELVRSDYIKNSLETKEGREYAFFYFNRGILVRNVVEHNIETRKVFISCYNSKYDREMIDLNDCYIIGKVIGLYRNKYFNINIMEVGNTVTERDRKSVV